MYHTKPNLPNQTNQIKITKPDMRFVKNFTQPDFQAQNFTPVISPNFNSLQWRQWQISPLNPTYQFKPSQIELWIVYWNTQESKRTKTSGSVVSLAMFYFSVGICVDFCAHIVHGFLTEHGSRGRVSSLNINMNEFVCVSRKKSSSYYGACGTGCYEWWVAYASKTTKGCCLDDNFYLKLRFFPLDTSKEINN